jgi:peroxiredoxin family protein
VEKLSVVLASDEFEKLQAGCMMASVASVSGIAVNVFVTMAAMTCFRQKTVADRSFPKIGEVGQAAIRKKAPLFSDLLIQGKEMGSLKVFACALALDLIDSKLEEMVPVFDEVVGVATFLGKAEGGQVLFV